MLNNDDRYKYLIDARNYHFTQFNIWMVFFITINGALLAAYYNLLNNNLENSNSDHVPEVLLILFLGYIAAFLFYCSAKGYNYWTNNFIKLLVEYENRNVKYDNDRVYSCIANKKKDLSYLNPVKPANISTFKVVMLFAYLLTYAWGILITHKCMVLCPFLRLNNLSLWLEIVIITLAGIFITFIIHIVFVYFFAKKVLKSDIAADIYKDLELEFENNTESKSGKQNQIGVQL